jgi:hypothetical protein
VVHARRGNQAVGGGVFASVPKLFAVALPTLALAALVWALPAAGKDGVEATLTTDLPLDAKPGTELKMAWTLGYIEDGRRREFGGFGVFVRLLSASGSAAETAFANQDTGPFTATVLVPEGGIADVEIGIRGYTSGQASSRPSDLLFPITNDPLPGPARTASAPADRPVSERPESRSETWIFVLVAGLLVAIGAAVALARRARATTAGLLGR